MFYPLDEPSETKGAQEHLPKSVERFSDKRCGKNKRLEQSDEPSETKGALEQFLKNVERFLDKKQFLKRAMVFAVSMSLVSMSLVFVSLAATSDDLPPARSFAGAYLAGRIAGANHDIEAATSYLEQALVLEPDYEVNKQDLFLFFLGSGQFEQSLALAHALSDRSDVEHFTDVWRFSRLVLTADAFKRSKLDEIEKDTLALYPDVIDELVTKLIDAWVLLARGEPKDALKQFESLSGPAWYQMIASYNMALIYVMLEEEKAAEVEFEAILANKEGGAAAPDAYERAVTAYAAFKLARGDRQTALVILQRGEQLLSGRHVLTHLREHLMAGGDMSPFISSAVEGAAEALYIIGSALSRSDIEIYGRLYLHVALYLRPSHDASLFQLAEIANKVGAHDEAIGYYRQIKADSFYFRDANIRLALTLAETQKEEEAIFLLEQLLAQSWQDDNLVMTLASLYMQVKNFSAVVELLTPYMEEGEEVASWRFFYQRGIAYERLNLWDQAESNFRAALRLEPAQPQILNYLGYSLIDRNLKLDEALNMVVRAVSLQPQDGYIIDSLGWAYYKLGRYAQAVEELERAVRLRPEDATINDHLGDAYWRVGRRFEATFQWNHAIAGKPEAEELAKIEEKLKNGLQDTHDEGMQDIDNAD